MLRVSLLSPDQGFNISYYILNHVGQNNIYISVIALFNGDHFV